ncbi:antitoxin MazE-like protein [Sphingomonas sp. PAMC 26605]|uniref:antitoxin MazE-like protein n=1 Tax=Sphingomonas sp. PAMC 26605 TaxID=1112214 RepID=UPI001E487148|nr:antitoxin MazE-like protein [Sphingomonas sp. PAMC 26605]
MTSAERVAKRRAALRAQGLRPKTFWLPDTSTPEFRARAEASTAWLWERASEEEQAMAFVEAMTDDLLADLDRREAEG